MKEITQHSYIKEVKDLAFDLLAETMSDNNNDREVAMEKIQDCLLHETIDGHEWIIYTYYNQLIVNFSNNDDAYLDVYSSEDLGELIKEKGLDAVVLSRAFYAFHQDVQDALHEIEEEEKEE